MRFFTGLHQPSDAMHFDSAFISVNRLRSRKGPFVVGDWIMDSGAFTESVFSKKLCGTDKKVV